MPVVFGEVDANLKGVAKNRRGVIGFSVPSGNANWESGVGALLPWADRLWVSTYLAETNQVSGSGLYSINQARDVKLEHQHNGCHAGRMVHKESEQAFIANCVVSKAGSVTPIPTFTGTGQFHRITAWTRHRTTPSTHVYAVTMAGLVFEVNVTTLAATQVANAATALGIVGQPHFKGAWCTAGATARLYVVNNTDQPDGRLAMWDGTTWTTLSSLGGAIEVYAGVGPLTALGLDGPPHGPLSAVLYMIDNDGTGNLRRFRLPLPDYAFTYYLRQEWMRRRMVSEFGHLMCAYGLMYRMGVQSIGGGTWAGGSLYPSIVPVCRYLRAITDFCFWDGNFVYGANDLAPGDVSEPTGGQANSGITFGDLEDLAQWGKPVGVGYFQKSGALAANAKTDPMLMRGFDGKTLHIINNDATDIPLGIRPIQGSTELGYMDILVPAGKYWYHTFPHGYSADWLRLVGLGTAINSMSAWVTYS